MRCGYRGVVRAVTYAEFGGPLSVAELAEPSAPPGAAVVRVLASGLCRSDWHGWRGHDADIRVFPHVPGHEFAGIVESVGSGVDRRWVGRDVTAPFVLACGACAVCRAGAASVCPNQRQPGFTDPGTFAQRVVIHSAQTNLVALPPGLGHEQAAGLGCRIATAYRAVTARGRVRAGETVAVFGCGGLGLAAIMIAAARGASVIAVDVHEAALARAAEVGARACLLADEQVSAAIGDLTGGGADLAIDALGSPDTLRMSIESLGRRGRHLQVGLLPATAAVPMSRVIAWELDVLGCHGMAAADYGPLLDDVASGALDVQRLLAPRPPLSLGELAQVLPTLPDLAAAGIVLVDPSR